MSVLTIHRPIIILTTVWLCLVVCLQATANAELPTGYAVNTGNATFQQHGNTLDVTATAHSVIDYQTFSIGTENTVNVNSPVSLHRVISNTPSHILGQLNSTGHLFLVNQNGIVFGKNAQVNVGSLTASTLAVDTKAFQQGHLVFQKAGDTGIENNGNINANNSIQLH
jgi:filamentous hemagglutinin family protein